MATTIKTKNSVTTTVAPTTLQQGELAVNITDKKMWVGNAATTPVQLFGAGADSTFTNISVSGVASFADGTVSLPSITNIGDTNTGMFFPAADTIAFTEGGTEAMRLNSAGNMGIGETSIASDTRLHLKQTADNCILKVQSSFGSILNLINGGGSEVSTINATGNNVLTMQTGSTERMRIDSTGNVGIGTTSPSDPLQIQAKSAGQAVRIQGRSSDGYGSLSFYNNANNTLNGYLDVNNANMFFGTNTSIPLIFYTNGTERMRIDSSGNVLVGDTGSTVTSGKLRVLQTTTDSNYISRIQSSAASGMLGLSIYYSGASPNGTGNVFLVCEDTTTTRMAVRSNGGIANYSANDVNLSDAREKTNIELAGSYLNKICSIPVKTFNYIDQNLEDDDGLTLGVIAQDVQTVAPELVMESNWAAKDEPEKMRLSIYQTDLQYALMKSIQELKAELDSVKAELQTLKGK